MISAFFFLTLSIVDLGSSLGRSLAGRGLRVRLMTAVADLGGLPWSAAWIVMF